MLKKISMCIFAILFLCTIANAGDLLIATEAVTNGTSVTANFSQKNVPGYFTLVGSVAATGGTRAVSVELYIKIYAADGTSDTGWVLESTPVSDWTSDMTNSDVYQKIGGESGIYIGYADEVQVKVTGLAGSGANVTMFLKRK